MDRMSGGEPALHFEAPSTPETPQENAENRAENQPAHQESAPSKAPSAPSQAVPQLNLATDSPAASDNTAQVAAQKPDPQKSVITAPLHAADANNIEKEWVDALKMVEARTKNDPFKQNQEVSRIKMDYQLKRFNKKPNTDEAIIV